MAAGLNGTDPDTTDADEHDGAVTEDAADVCGETEPPGSGHGSGSESGSALEEVRTGGEDTPRSWWRAGLAGLAAVFRRRGFLIAAIVLLAGSTAFAAWAGWSWYRAGNDDSVTYARARDAALEEGRENLAILSSLDHQRVDEGIGEWIEVSAGPLQQRLQDSTDETITTLREAGTVAQGDVLDAGITELDEYAGTATMVAVVEIRKSTEDGRDATERHRFTAGLKRTDEGWKLDSLNQLPLDID